MIYISRRKAFVASLFIIMIITSFLFPYKKIPVFSHSANKCIVLDPGHGFPDGGAVGINKSIESTLNLKIALLTKNMLQKKGYTVIMTRSDENSIWEQGTTISEKKKSDMHRRLEIINTSDADMFISIHLNKFSDTKYQGAQVLYSKNFVQSQILAESIQKELCLLKENIKKRSHLKAPKGLFLMENARIPAVIVECGFLSNAAEEELLNTKDYQKSLAKAIVSGIEKYYRKAENL